jgi:hypothetical protein
MKKTLWFVAGVLLALSVTGCPQADETPSGNTNRTLKISNQSSTILVNVTWDSIDFDLPGGGADPYWDSGLALGRSNTMQVPGDEAEISSYVYFSLPYLISSKAGPYHTQELIVVRDEPVEFKITDNTIVVNSSGTLGLLSSFF